MRSSRARAASFVVVTAITVGAVGACRSAPDAPPAPAAASASAVVAAAPRPLVSVSASPLASGVPVAQAKIDRVLNPAHAEPYAGPTGVVEGTVRMTGDPSPVVTEGAIPFGCTDALVAYGKLLREGLDRTVADVLVTVTDYQGYLPPKGEVRAVKIHGCAYDTRTVDVTFGQRIEVFNTDPKTSYLPSLVGAWTPAENVAIPRGESVKLYPREPGHYALKDSMNRKWMYADVFVLKYPTHTVTGLDGHFRIEGVPVGKVNLAAYLPVLDKAIEQKVDVKAGETIKVDVTIPFDAKHDAPTPAPAASSAPAKPR